MGGGWAPEVPALPERFSYDRSIMFGQLVREVMEHKRLLTAPPQTTVSEAARLMADRNVGAIVVIEDGRLAGIFTERDVVFRVVARGGDPQTIRLAEVMTASPLTIGPDKTYGHALLMMHEGGFRHVPVVEAGKLVGIVSSRNALDPDMEEFVVESHRRRHLKATLGST
jgi:CBS domain-containing protein